MRTWAIWTFCWLCLKLLNRILEVTGFSDEHHWDADEVWTFKVIFLIVWIVWGAIVIF